MSCIFEVFQKTPEVLALADEYLGGYRVRADDGEGVDVDHIHAAADRQTVILQIIS